MIFFLRGQRGAFTCMHVFNKFTDKEENYDYFRAIFLNILTRNLCLIMQHIIHFQQYMRLHLRFFKVLVHTPVCR